MRARRALCPWLFVAAGCGGSAAIDAPGAGSDPASTAGSGNAAAGASSSDQTQEVDPVGEPGAQSPVLPPGSSSFFWRGGLGNWFVSWLGGSRDASIDDVVPARGDSQKAYHVTQSAPGAAIDLWAQLQHPQGTAIDLSAYTGVSFWARLDEPSGDLTVAFGANGGFSNAATLVAVPRKVLPLSRDWAQYQVKFADVGLDSSAVSSIDFVIDGSGGLLGLWVDELGFTCRGSCPE